MASVRCVGQACKETDRIESLPAIFLHSHIYIHMHTSTFIHTHTEIQTHCKTNPCGFNPRNLCLSGFWTFISNTIMLKMEKEKKTVERPFVKLHLQGEIYQGI